MSRLLVKNISTLVSCGPDDRVCRNVDLLCADGRIESIRPSVTGGGVSGGEADFSRAAAPDRVIDATGMICYPGLINTHHHLYQIFSRNLPQVQNLELFDWLTALYGVWKNLNTETVRLSSLTGIGELMKNGCTTVFDHHYVFPAGAGDLIEAQWEAACTLGCRMHFSRGSMDRSKKDGGLPPDSVVQTVDEIMRDSRRLIEKWNDTSFTSMHRIALAPCSPFSVSADLMRESARLARASGVRLHTHLCETKDEERFTLETTGMRPLAYMETLAASIPSTTLYNIDPALDEPIRGARNEELLEESRQSLEQLRAQLESADPSETQLLEERVAEAEEHLAQMEKYWWEIPESSIAWYRAHADGVVISPVNWLYANNSGEGYELISQYLDGSMSLDELLREIDHKVQMMMMEGN